MGDTKLYHYTSIETLALILKNKTLRFNRLDKVNDPEESEYYVHDFLGKAYYVSCWTKSTEESIPLWNLYADAAKGIRIEAVEDSFLHQSFITEAEQILKKVDFLASWSDWSPSYKCFEINYDEVKGKSIHGRTRLRISSGDEEPIEENLKQNVIGPEKKNPHWRFEEEYRLCINAIGSFYNPDKQITVLNNLPEYLDLKLPHTFLDSFRVMVGPKASDGNKAIVEALLKAYVTNFDFSNPYEKSEIRIR